LISRELRTVALQAKNKNASGGGGGMAKIRGLEAKKRPELSGRGFLQERVYTDFYFFVKRNFQLFLFFLELVSFQVHSCRIPIPIHPCADWPRAGSRANRGGQTCRII
jgi:hypothetical protein